ncbi:PilN domain-containing protein [Metasolibacillus meyeri]|uniref:PilN domain-containing protein n=1 Tax=Metasolibacillus meyeri TaxID=1071052 RepID=UPI000D32691A|nr:PilN domain-containing protein [Metasolibacillus meyeri]
MIPDINLLPHVSRSESNFKIFYSILAIVALLILSFIIWQFFSAKSEVTKLTNEQQTLQAQKDRLQSEYDALLANNTGSIQQAVAFVEKVSYPVSPLMDEIRTLLLANSYLRNYTFDQQKVIVQADFETFTDISKYVALLEHSEYFNDVQLGTVKDFEVDPNNDIKENEVDFSTISRYSVQIELYINEIYLATGGAQHAKQ